MKTLETQNTENELSPVEIRRLDAMVGDVDDQHVSRVEFEELKTLWDCLACSTISVDSFKELKQRIDELIQAMDSSDIVEHSQFEREKVNNYVKELNQMMKYIHEKFYSNEQTCSKAIELTTHIGEKLNQTFKDQISIIEKRLKDNKSISGNFDIIMENILKTFDELSKNILKT